MTGNKLENFFKLNDNKYLIGICMVVCSFVLLWLGSAYNYYMLIFGIAVAVVGIFLFITGSFGRVGVETLDAERDKKLIGFGDTLTEDPHVYKKKSEHHESTVIVTYDYEGENLRSRHGKYGWRTSECSAFRIDYLHDAIAIAYRSFSLLGDRYEDKPHMEFKYTDLSRAEVVRDTVRLQSDKDFSDVTRARLRIYGNDGTMLFSSQVPDDCDSDAIAEQICRFIQHGSVI